MLEIKNDWHALSYAINGADIPAESSGVLTVKWPDGATEELPFTYSSRNVNYSDMGTPCTARQTTWHVGLIIHGARMQIEVATISHLVQKVEVG